MSDRPYQLLPPLDEQQRFILRQSIEKNGVLEPVVFDEEGEILDGHHRVEIAEELEIDYPRRVVADLDEAGKRQYAITTNVARRHLSQTVRGSLVAQLRSQGMSIRRIAETTGLPKTTVARDLDQVSQVGHLTETVTGADGKKYAAARPTPTPGPVDAADTPLADPGATPAPAAEPPVSPQESDPPEDGLAAEVFSILADFAPSVGMTVAEIWSRLPSAHSVKVQGAVLELSNAGRVLMVSTGSYGARWVVAPERAAAPSTAAADSGPGDAAPPVREDDDAATPPPGSPATWTPEQVAANRSDVEARRMRESARRHARTIVTTIRSEIYTVTVGAELGEHGLVTAEMVAELRDAVEHLAKFVEVPA